VARVVVNVMPKAEILDPQGQAIVGALRRLGHAGISDVRQGKRFELELDDSVDDATLAEINPLIVTPEREVRALDAKVSLDGNAELQRMKSSGEKYIVVDLKGIPSEKRQPY